MAFDTTRIKQGECEASVNIWEWNNEVIWNFLEQS